MKPTVVSNRALLNEPQCPNLQHLLEKLRETGHQVSSYQRDDDKEVAKVMFDETGRHLSLTTYHKQPRKVHIQGRQAGDFLGRVRSILSIGEPTPTGPSVTPPEPTRHTPIGFPRGRSRSPHGQSVKFTPLKTPGKRDGSTSGFSASQSPATPKWLLNTPLTPLSAPTPPHSVNAPTPPQIEPEPLLLLPLQLAVQMDCITQSQPQMAQVLASMNDRLMIDGTAKELLELNLMQDIKDWAHRTSCPTDPDSMAVEILLFEKSPGHPMAEAILTFESLSDHILGLAALREQDVTAELMWEVRVVVWKPDLPMELPAKIDRPFQYSNPYSGGPFVKQTLVLGVHGADEELLGQLSVPVLPPPADALPYPAHDGHWNLYQDNMCDAKKPLVSPLELFQSYKVTTQVTVEGANLPGQQPSIVHMISWQDLRFQLLELYGDQCVAGAPNYNLLITLEPRNRGGGRRKQNTSSDQGLENIIDLLRQAVSNKQTTPSRPPSAPPQTPSTQSSSDNDKRQRRRAPMQLQLGQLPQVSEYRIYIHEPSCTAAMEGILEQWLATIKQTPSTTNLPGPGPALVEVWWNEMVNDIDRQIPETQDPGHLQVLHMAKQLLAARHFMLGSTNMPLILKDAIYAMYRLGRARSTPPHKRRNDGMEIDQDDTSTWKLILRTTQDGVMLATILQKLPWQQAFLVTGAPHPLFEVRAHHTSRKAT